ncbi:hypothetical protein [Sneathiella sp.]|uniref:hypothetical protein n=1 Tax=Sneathiella sp. TaxID=1964365 RepID=UPI0035654C2F
MTYQDLAQMSLAQWIQIFAAIAAPIVAHIWVSIIKKKPALIWTARHQFFFLVPASDANTPNDTEQNSEVEADNLDFIHYQTMGFFFLNKGRASALNIEIIFNFKPEHFEFWPPIAYETTLNPDNRFIINIDRLGPKSNFNLELLGRRDPPKIVRVISEDGETYLREFSFEPKPSNAILAVCIIIFGIGLATTAYFTAGLIINLFS